MQLTWLLYVFSPFFALWGMPWQYIAVYLDSSYGNVEPSSC